MVAVRISLIYIALVTTSGCRNQPEYPIAPFPETPQNSAIKDKSGLLVLRGLKLTSDSVMESDDRQLQVSWVVLVNEPPSAEGEVRTSVRKNQTKIRVWEVDYLGIRGLKVRSSVSLPGKTLKSARIKGTSDTYYLWKGKYSLSVTSILLPGKGFDQDDSDLAVALLLQSLTLED